MAQRLFDRIMFIAFCEDRGLLPEKTIPKAYSVAGFHAATILAGRTSSNLFRFIDVGSEPNDIPKYNGGLFAPARRRRSGTAGRALDQLLQQRSAATTSPTKSISTCWATCSSGRSRSSNEAQVERPVWRRCRKGRTQYATMPQSVKRKQLGIYYTPQRADQPDRPVHGRRADRRAVRRSGA